ncbi:MAG: hypothetical protein NTZ05_05600, partial [Chloroflexi bacterium]|nr:hypothetical protein [Chloroflexota bacterium]
TADPSGTVGAGSTVPATAQAITSGGQSVPVAGITVTWSATGQGGSFATPASQTNAEGKATVQFTVGTQAGTLHTVTAVQSGPSPLTGNSPALLVAAAAPAKYLVSVGPGAVTAGQPAPVRAQLADAYNNPVALSGRTVTWSATPAGSGFSPASSLTDVAGVATVQFTSGASAGVSYSVRATDASSVTGSSPAFTTRTPVALRLETQPVQAAQNGDAVEVRIVADAAGNQLDGVQFRLTFDPTKLQAVDADGQSANGINLQAGTALGLVVANVVNPATGVATFGLTRTAAQGPASGTLMLGSFWLRGLAAGVQPVTFVAGSVEVAFGGLSLGYTTQNGAVDVRAKGLRFVRQPVRGANGVGLGVQPVVAITDASGAVITGDSTTVVTLGVLPGSGTTGSSLGCAQTVGGVTQVQAVNGIATFSGCAFTLPGADFRLSATSAAPEVAATASGKFNVTLAGDTDGSCRVSIVDVSQVVTHYGKDASAPEWANIAMRAYQADLDGDGRIGVLDFSVVVSRFASGAAVCAPASNPAMVVLSDTGVLPLNVTVQVGQPVLFVNAGTAAHTATADGAIWNSGLIGLGQTYGYVFLTPGVFTYQSTQAGDGALVGTVTVQAAAPPIPAQ